MQMQSEKGKAPVASTTEALSEANPYHKESNMSDSKAVQVSSQPVFNFGAHNVRVILRDGEPWFVAKDVCDALEYSNSRGALADHLDPDEKGVANADTPGGQQQMQVISESGLYALVLRSRKPEARKFAKWVTSEVLPAIRKTGVYVGKPFTVNPGDVLTQDEQNTLRLMLKSAVEKLPKEKQAGAMIKGWSKLKAHFGVAYREIPRQEFSEAVSIIARHTAEWELVEDEPAPAYDEERVRIAFSLAAEASAQVQRTIFDAVMAGEESAWRHNRYLLNLNYDRNSTPSIPWAKALAFDDMVISMEELPERLTGYDPIHATDVQLAKLAKACSQKLEQRAQHRTDKASALKSAA